MLSLPTVLRFAAGDTNGDYVVCRPYCPAGFLSTTPSLLVRVLTLLLFFLSPGGEVGVQVGSGELVNRGGNGGE